VLSFPELYALNNSTGLTRESPSKAPRPHILASRSGLQTVSEACPPQEPSRILGSQPQLQYSSLFGELGLKLNMSSLQDRDPPALQYVESQGPTLPCQGVTEIVTTRPTDAYPVLVT
jgi:hypothetical protein